MAVVRGDCSASCFISATCATATAERAEAEHVEEICCNSVNGQQQAIRKLSEEECAVIQSLRSNNRKLSAEENCCHAVIGQQQRAGR